MNYEQIEGPKPKKDKEASYHTRSQSIPNHVPIVASIEGPYHHPLTE